MASRCQFERRYERTFENNLTISLGTYYGRKYKSDALQLKVVDKNGRTSTMTNEESRIRINLDFKTGRQAEFPSGPRPKHSLLYISYRPINQLQDMCFQPLEVDNEFCRRLKEWAPRLHGVHILGSEIDKKDTPSNDTESDSEPELPAKITPKAKSKGLPKPMNHVNANEQLYYHADEKEPVALNRQTLEPAQLPATVNEIRGETLPLDPEASLNSGTNETSDNGEPTSTLPSKPADQSESDSHSSTGSIDMPIAQLRHGLSLQRKPNAMSNCATDTVEETSIVETPVEDCKPATKERSRRFRGLPPKPNLDAIALLRQELEEQSPARDEDNCGGKVGNITANLEDFFRRRKLAANNPEEHNFMLIGILLFILVVVLLFKRFTQHYAKNGDEDNNDAQEAEVDNNIV